jgi:hypothetical protein
MAFQKRLFSFYLDEHLDGKNSGEHVVSSAQEHPLSALGWNVGALHGECDTIQSDEKQHHVVKPALLDELLAGLPEPDEAQKLPIWSTAPVPKHMQKGFL